MSASHPAPSPAQSPALRPLPPRPDLEFEHKAAKALLRRLRAGDPEAIARARARHPALDPAAPERARLADAQLVVAREYGFASWPRLVRWFGDVERRQLGRTETQHRPEFYESSVRGWLALHAQRREWVGRALAAYVPRFLGLRVADVLDAAVTEDDVRLALARQHGAPSWEVLLERAAATAARPRPDEWAVTPLDRARRAVAALDLDALGRVVDDHPELLHPSAEDRDSGRNVLSAAVWAGRARGDAAVGPILDWLAARGLDVRRELNAQLCGGMRMQPGAVRWLLDMGADPNWVAPNGIPVLEHALIRYWNGAAVDLLAARAAPRDALWIAAGLGDVAGVARFLDRRGRPTKAARRLRPDFDVVGHTIPALPDPDDEELLVEALFVAVLNGRGAVIDLMAARGAPVNSMIYGQSLAFVAAGNAWTAALAALVRNGADLDLRGWRPAQSARENARAMLEHLPQDPARRRVAELCGLDPDAVLAARDARSADPLGTDPALRAALELAGDDAVERGAREVDAEGLLFGLLRAGGLPLLLVAQASRMERERFHLDLAPRLRPAEARVARPALPLGAEAQALVQAAIDAATERRRHTVQGVHLLGALLRDAHGPAAAWLARYGGDVGVLRAEVERAM